MANSYSDITSDYHGNGDGDGDGEVGNDEDNVMIKAIGSLSRWLSRLLPLVNRSPGRHDHIVISIMDTSLAAEADYII